MPYALTIRLPDQVYRAAKNIASERGISMNRLVEEAIAEKADKALEKRLKKAYDLLAEDQEEADAEVFLAAQAEIILAS